MERFVRLIVVGGIALVAGLWLVVLATAGSVPWLLGVGLVVVGTAGLLVGTGTELEWWAN